MCASDAIAVRAVVKPIAECPISSVVSVMCRRAAGTQIVAQVAVEDVFRGLAVQAVVAEIAPENIGVISAEDVVPVATTLK